MGEFAMLRVTVFGMTLFSLIFTHNLTAGVWEVENDDKFKRDWRIEVKDGRRKVKRTIKFGESTSFNLSNNQVTYWTTLSDGTQEMEHTVKNLRGKETISSIRTPILADQQTGFYIYDDMPGHRASKESKDRLELLENSSWKGTYQGNVDGNLNLNGGQGDGGRGVKLANIKYIAGTTFYIVGDWTHRNEKGQFVLSVNPKSLNPIEGQFRTKTARNSYSKWEKGKNIRRIKP
jgi:hypothetical protein